MKRYVNQGMNGQVKDKRGNWVKFEDYEKLEAENEKLKKHIQSKYTAVWDDIKTSYDVKADLTKF